MKRSEWTLYWPDRNSRFHLYELIEPTQHVAELPDEIRADPARRFMPPSKQGPTWFVTA